MNIVEKQHTTTVSAFFCLFFFVFLGGFKIRPILCLRVDFKMRTHMLALSTLNIHIAALVATMLFDL